VSPKARFNLAYALVALLAVVAVNDWWTRSHEVAVVPYSLFEQQLEQGNVQEVLVSSDTISGELRQPLREGPFAGKRRFTTARVEERMAQELSRRGVEYRGMAERGVIPSLLSWLLPLLFFGALWALLFRRVGAGGPGAGLLAIGKSKAKVLVDTDVKTRFQEVAGVDEAKAELEEVVAFLRDPRAHGRLGARMPKGVLLVGPPGTGKTLLARAVAGEARVPFFSISGSEFVEMFVGVGAARVRDLFEQARSRAPCIIFIDELDALGRARGALGGLGGVDEKEQTLNQLLVELDGFDPTSGIVLLAATNRPEMLDPALLRAGRFDRQVLVDRPDRAGRAQILEVHLARVKRGADVDPQAIAQLTPGFTGADLANLVNEAALAATRRDAPEVSAADFTAAIERIVAGLEKRNRLLDPREREAVAFHEMGHALVAAAQPGTDAVHKISVVPRGMGALGYTLQRPAGDRYLMTRGELEAKMAVLLGGRAAEALVFGQLSTGAADDLSRATEIARGMAMRYAMVPELGAVAYEAEPQPFLPGLPDPRRRLYAEQTAREIDEAVRGLLGEAAARATRILARNRALLEEGARELLRRETLADGALQALLGRVQPEPAAAPRPVAAV
jgi:cell division protease FtsH